MEPIRLWEDQKATLTPYPLSGDSPRPAVLVIPGGGYCGVCTDHEGEQIARRFNGLGLHAFVLDYRVIPNRFPAAQEDAARALRIIRSRAAEWRVAPDNIAACGFSAGAHLAACLGTLPPDFAGADDSLRAVSFTPDALILAYGVFSRTAWTEADVKKITLPEAAAEYFYRFFPAEHIHAQTPPAFFWHTADDDVVPYRNSVDFAEKLLAAGKPCELHLFPSGRHGLALAADRPDIRRWPEMARTFLETTAKFRFAAPAPR